MRNRSILARPGRLSVDGLAAVSQQRRTCDETGRLSGKKESRLGYVLRLSQPSDGRFTEQGGEPSRLIQHIAGHGMLISAEN